MLAYGFAKGVRLGWLPPEFLTAALRAYHGLLENMIRIDARGALTLEGTCSVAGLGGTPYRDGSLRILHQRTCRRQRFQRRRPLHPGRAGTG